MSIHHEAMKHLDKARVLLASGKDDDLRYAALEMRYCIEHLFYKVIPQYKDELPDNVLRGDIWKPGDIINMIAAIDPGVIHDRSLRMGFEPAPGVPAQNMWHMGSQTGLRRDLARRLWNGLGYYLHARTDQREHDYTKLRKKLEKVLPRLEQFRADRIIMSGFQPRTTSRCVECGRSLGKRAAAITDDPRVRCLTDGCEALYELKDHGDSNIEWKLLEESLKCRECGADNWLGVHKWKKGARANSTVTCCGCGFVYQLFEYVMVKNFESEGTSSDRRSNSA